MTTNAHRGDNVILGIGYLITNCCNVHLDGFGGCESIRVHKTGNYTI